MANLISRAAALDAIFGCFNVMESKGVDMTVARTIVKGVLDGAPAVDTVPVVHGEWTERHVDYASDCAIDEVQTAKCSVCGLYHTTPYLYSFADYNFCPNCGARMDGERRDEDATD